MFHPGDIVSYGTNGVCEITEQKRVRLAGQPCDCLILKPVYDQSMTICVPCTSQVLLDRMRPLPTKEELLAMLHEPAPAHEADADARKEQYRQALQSGDRHRLLRMVRDIHDSYHNMLEKIQPHFHLVENARKAIRAAGLEPIETPVRGGTDGATLSYMGLPCPNLGTGGFNFHGPCECITAEKMDQCTEILLNLVDLYK